MLSVLYSVGMVIIDSRGGILMMAMKEAGEIYRCSIFGNEVRMITAGRGILICCGQDMQIIRIQQQAQVNLPDTGG